MEGLRTRERGYAESWKRLVGSDRDWGEERGANPWSAGGRGWACVGAGSRPRPRMRPRMCRPASQPGWRQRLGGRWRRLRWEGIQAEARRGRGRSPHPTPDPGPPPAPPRLTCSGPAAADAAAAAKAATWGGASPGAAAGRGRGRLSAALGGPLPPAAASRPGPSRPGPARPRSSSGGGSDSGRAGSCPQCTAPPASAPALTSPTHRPGSYITALSLTSHSTLLFLHFYSSRTLSRAVLLELLGSPHGSQPFT